jgi:hypothetical protein
LQGLANANANSGQSENTFNIQARNDDGSFKAVIMTMMQNSQFVGVGSAPPTELFTVHKPSAPKIRINSNANGYPGLELTEASSRKWFIYNDPDDKLMFRPSTAFDALTIMQTGLTGINQATPVQRLHVLEDNSNSARDIIALFERTGTTKQARLVLKDGSGTSTDSRLMGVQFSSVSSNASFVNYEAGDWVWWTGTSAGSATRRMRIANSGQVTIGDESTTASSLFAVKGNAVIGSGLIGTSAPTNGLLVQGDTNLQSSLAVGTNTNTGLSAGDINASTIYYNVLTAKSPIILCSDDWCSVDLPKNKENYYIQKDDNWNILQINSKDGKVIGSSEFIYENGFIVGAVKIETINEILNKTKGLRDELKAEKERKILEEEARIIEEQEKIAKESLINNCKYQGYVWKNESCYNVFNESVTYEKATEKKPVYNITLEEYSCTILNKQLIPEQTTCLREIQTQEIVEYEYIFKEDCNWNIDLGYYCNREVKI